MLTIRIFLALIILSLSCAGVYSADPNNPTPCDVSCIIDIADAKICKGKDKILNYTITNNGGNYAVFTVTATVEGGNATGSVNSNATQTFELNPGESEIGAPAVHINSNSLRGSTTLKLKATAACFGGLTKTVTITVPNPNVSGSLLGPPRMCENRTNNGVLLVTNNGDCTENYTASLIVAGEGVQPSIDRPTFDVPPRTTLPLPARFRSIVLPPDPATPGSKLEKTALVHAHVVNNDTGDSFDTNQLSIRVVECPGDGDPTPGDSLQGTLSVSSEACLWPGIDESGVIIPGFFDSKYLSIQTGVHTSWGTQKSTAQDIITYVRLNLIDGDPSVVEFTTWDGQPYSLGGLIPITNRGVPSNTPYNGDWSSESFLKITALKHGRARFRIWHGSGPNSSVPVAPAESIISVRVTVAGLIYDIPASVSADEHQLWSGVAIIPTKAIDPVYNRDGEKVSFDIYKLNQPVTSEITVKNNVAIMNDPLTPFERAGSGYSIGVKYWVGGQDTGCPCACENENFVASYNLFEYTTGTIITAGQPYSLALQTERENILIDGAQITRATVEVKDAAGNLAIDAMASWDFSDGPLHLLKGVYQKNELMPNGQGAASIYGLQAERSGTLVVRSGAQAITRTLGYEPPTGTIVAPLTTSLEGPGYVDVTINTNAYDGASVYWYDYTPNADLAGARDGTTYVLAGKSTWRIPVTSIDQLGAHLISAAIGGRVFFATVEYTSTRGFRARLSERAIVGDRASDGTFTFDPTQTAPIPGLGVPPIAPSPRTVAYSTKTILHISGTPGEQFYAGTRETADQAFVQISNLSSLGVGVVGPNGFTALTVQSTGAWEGSYSTFLSRTLPLRVRSMSAGGDEWFPTFVIAEHSAWAYVYDGFQSFLGGDPTTPVGFGTNIAGGVLIIGDVGSLIKNAWRIAGFSNTPPSYSEMTLSSLGLLTELAVGAGEAADVPITSVRSIVAYLRGSSFADVLCVMLKRAVSNATDLAKFTKFLQQIVVKPFRVNLYKVLFPSEELVAQAVSVTAKVDDKIDEALSAIDEIAQVAAKGGIESAQKVMKVLDEIPSSTLQTLKASPKFAQALEGMAITLKYIDPELLKRILVNDLFDNAYGVADLLIDMGKVADCPGFQVLATNLHRKVGSALNSGRFGFLYELQVAVALRQAGGARPTLLSQLAPNSVLGNTDIDIIIGAIYYQVKRSKKAFLGGKKESIALAKTRMWVEKALAHAAKAGIPDAAVKYVHPPGVDVPASILAYLAEAGIEILTIPALGRAATGR